MTNTHNTDEPEATDGDTRSVNRRRFVKSLGVSGAAAVFGATAQASAKKPKSSLSKAEAVELAKREQEARSRYDNPDAVRSVLNRHASEFLQTLSDQGYIEKSIEYDFNLDNVKQITEVSEPGERVTIDSYYRKETDDILEDIVITKFLPDGVLNVHILPKTGKKYAIINPSSEDMPATVLDGTKDEKVTPEFCRREKGCPSNYQCFGPGGCNIGRCSRTKRVVNCSDGSCYYDPCYCGCCRSNQYWDPCD